MICWIGFHGLKTNFLDETSSKNSASLLHDWDHFTLLKSGSPRYFSLAPGGQLLSYPNSFQDHAY